MDRFKISLVKSSFSKHVFHIWNATITYGIPNAHVKWTGLKFRMWNVGVQNLYFIWNIIFICEIKCENFLREVTWYTVKFYVLGIEIMCVYRIRSKVGMKLIGRREERLNTHWKSDSIVPDTSFFRLTESIMFDSRSSKVVCHSIWLAW